MPRPVRAGLLLLLLAALAPPATAQGGAGVWWGSLQKDANNTWRSALPAPRRCTERALWEPWTRCGMALLLVGTGDVLVATCADENTALAFSVGGDFGRPLWQYTTAADDALYGAAASADRIFLLSERFISAVELNGKQIWNVTAPVRPLSVPPTLTADGATVLIASDGMLLALNAATGQRRWAVPQHCVTFGPVTYRGTVIAALADPKTDQPAVVALDLLTGAVQWTTQFPPQFAFVHLSLSDTGTLYALGESPLLSGQPRGTAPFGRAQLPSGGSGRSTTMLYALEAATGVERWSNDFGLVPMLAVGAGNRVYATTGTSLVALDGDRGAVDATLRLPVECGELVFITVAANDRVLVQCYDGATSSALLLAVETTKFEEAWRYNISRATAPGQTVPGPGGRLYAATLRGVAVVDEDGPIQCPN